MKPGIQSRIGSQSRVEVYATWNDHHTAGPMWVELLPLDLDIQCAVFDKHRDWRVVGHQSRRAQVAYIRSINS